MSHRAVAAFGVRDAVGATAARAREPKPLVWQVLGLDDLQNLVAVGGLSDQRDEGVDADLRRHLALGQEVLRKPGSEASRGLAAGGDEGQPKLLVAAGRDRRPALRVVRAHRSLLSVTVSHGTGVV